MLFNSVVSGTSIGTSSDKADSISIHSSRHGNTAPHAHDYAAHNRRTDIASAASDSVAPSPTEADFPLDSFGTQIRKVHDGNQADGSSGLEYLYDDPRRPYFSNISPSRMSWHFSASSIGGVSHHDTSSSASTDARKPGAAAQRNLAAGSSGITSSSSFSKSTVSSAPSSSYEDADHALPFANGAHVKNSSSFASSSAVHSDSDSSKHSSPNRPYAGPDRYVKTILTYATNAPSNRKGNRGGGSSGSAGSSLNDRPLSFKSMAKGPEGSNRVALAANDGKLSAPYPWHNA